MQNKAILIIGQTASGKTSLAHAICDTLREKKIFCEIVNLDAFQIYQDISIGTAKPSAEEQVKYHYHGIDLCRADETMDANVFAEFAREACRQINSKGNVPLCVGGSGLYLRAFLHGLDKFPAHDANIRQKIRNYAQEHGWEKCYEWLVKVDPVRAKELHPNDHVRIERALEIFEITQMPASALQTKKAPLFAQDVPFDSFVIQTVVDNETLRKNILNRTTELFRQGWLEEVQALYEKYGEKIWNLNSLRAIGYKAILSFLDVDVAPPHFVMSFSNSQMSSCGSQMSSRGSQMSSCGLTAGSTSLTQLIAQISLDTFKYAKRQKTWNKKEKTDFLIHPQNAGEYTKLIVNIENFVEHPTISGAVLD